MITHSFYECDNRVIRYAETLAERGDLVQVLALRSNPELPCDEVINGVRVYRIQDRFGKTEKKQRDYLWPVLRFLAVASRWLMSRHRSNPYDLVHVHSIPDFLVFAAWYPRLTAAKVILDIHDILPEFYASKFGKPERSLLVWGLRKLEKISGVMAHHVILANDLWLDRYASRSAGKEKCSVVLNHVDERLFYPRPWSKPTGAVPIVMFPGGLQWHQGLDIAIRAFGKLRQRLKRVEFHIYGDGNMKPQLVALVQELGLDDCIRFFAPLPIHDIVPVMAKADLGIVAKRADSFGNEAYSTKILEFMALGVPLVVSRTKIDRYYFDDQVVRFFESGNEDDMANAMFDVLTNEELRRAQARRAMECVALNSWSRHKVKYLHLVDSLIAERASQAGRQESQA